MTSEQIEKDFPRSDWIHINVSSPDDAQQVIVQLVFQTGKMCFGRSEWISEDNGVLLINKKDIDPSIVNIVNSINKPVKKKWYEKFFTFFK